FDIPIVVNVSVLWLALGFPLWIFDIFEFGDAPLTTFFAHIGSLSVGLFALSKIGVKKNSWIYSFLWFLFIQQICRLFTDPDFNINIAHNVRDAAFFNSYFQYWLATTFLTALLLLALEIVLSKIFKIKIDQV